MAANLEASGASAPAWAETYRTQELDRLLRRHAWTPRERALNQAYSRRLARRVLKAISHALIGAKADRRPRGPEPAGLTRRGASSPERPWTD